MRRLLLVPALVLVLAGCTATGADDEVPLPPDVVALQTDLAAVDGIESATVDVGFGHVYIVAEIDPAQTDAEQLAAAVGDLIVDGYPRAAVSVEFQVEGGRAFAWEGYDPAHHDRYAAALGIWWRALEGPHAVSSLGGFVAKDWFGLELDADPWALLEGESVTRRLDALRAEATAAGLRILESKFVAYAPFHNERVLELEPDALRHVPPSVKDILDDVETPDEIYAYLVGFKMDLLDDGYYHEIPTEIYVIPQELPGGGFPPFDGALAATALNALTTNSLIEATTDGARIDGIFLLTDSGLVRIDAE